MLKTLAALFGTILKYSQINTNIKSRDYDIRRTIFALIFAIMVSALVYTVKRLYTLTVLNGDQKGQIFQLEKRITDTERLLINSKLKAKRCKRRNRKCKTLSCTLEQTLDQ